MAMFPLVCANLEWFSNFLPCARKRLRPQFLGLARQDHMGGKTTQSLTYDAGELAFACICPPSMGLFRESSWGYFPTADLATGLRPASRDLTLSPGSSSPRTRGRGGRVTGDVTHDTQLPAHAWASEIARLQVDLYLPAPRARVGKSQACSVVSQGCRCESTHTAMIFSKCASVSAP